MAGLESDSDSDDELLNFQAFKSDTCKKPRRELDKEFPPPVIPKISSSTSNDAEEKIVSHEAKALKIVERATVPGEVKGPDHLYWYRDEKRKKGRKRKANTVHWLPCRTCHPDEAIGLNVGAEKWNQDKKVLIQFIEGTCFTQRSLVLKKQLVPYLGENSSDEDNLHAWCPEKLKQLSIQNGRSKKKGFQDETGIIAMELYMQKVLDTVVQRMQEIQKLEVQGIELDSSTHCEDIEDSPKSSGSALISQSQDVDESNCEGGYSSDGSDIAIRREKQKDVLRPGDHIAYYDPNAVHGDPRGYREAVVESINCKKELVLALQGGSFLDRQHRVQRIKKVFRGKLEDEDGTWKPVKSFKLQTARLKGTIGVAAEAKRLKEIVSRQKQITTEKLKADGLGGFVGFLK
mmetsp:Transcript_16643/g.24914  ORF Transcript_16643/g.24914 Transcript_16643/m.24914 type:complete len:403 (-) Transcript_16643:167-1375(-)